LRVIPILALLPFLAAGRLESEAAKLSSGVLRALPPAGQTLLLIGAVLAIVLAGRFIVRPFSGSSRRRVCRNCSPASALLIVIGIVLLMDYVGLDPALGAFLGGVVLADSEFVTRSRRISRRSRGCCWASFSWRWGEHQLHLLHQPAAVGGGNCRRLIVIKFVVLWALARLFGFDRSFVAFVFVRAGQGDEFAFVLFPSAVGMAVLSAAWSNIFVLAVAISIGADSIPAHVRREIRAAALRAAEGDAGG